MDALRRHSEGAGGARGAGEPYLGLFPKKSVKEENVAPSAPRDSLLSLLLEESDSGESASTPAGLDLNLRVAPLEAVVEGLVVERVATTLDGPGAVVGIQVGPRYPDRHIQDALVTDEPPNGIQPITVVITSTSNSTWKVESTPFK